jgi:3-hydroxybutyryl-CoA dehydrogenase
MKKPDQIKRIAVVGAGTMGAGIAQLSSEAGYETVLYDLMRDATVKGFESISENLRIAVEKNKISEEEKANVLSRIIVTSDFNDLVADVVIEAIVERLETKSELFQKLHH